MRVGLIGVFLLAAVGLFAGGAGAEDEGRKIVRIAVYDLAAESVEPRVATVVTESILAELRKLQRVSVIGTSEIRAMLDLEAEKQALGCESDSSCLSEIADALGVDYLVTGTLARVGTDHLFNLKSLNQREAKAGPTYNKVMPAQDGTELLSEVGPAVEELFPELPLKPGLERGVDESVARRMNPPPLPPAVFWTGAGTTAALLATAMTAGAFQLVYQAEYKSLAESSVSEEVPGALLAGAGQAAQTAELVGWSTLGAGLVIGALTAVSFPLVNFEELE